MDFRNLKLTHKEETLLSVLWEVKKPLTVKEICNHATDLNLSLNASTAQATINKFVKYGLLRVQEIKQTNTNFARAFVPTISFEQYSAIKVKQIIFSISINVRTNFIATLIQDEDLSDDELSKLTSMIEGLKNK